MYVWQHIHVKNHWYNWLSWVSGFTAAEVHSLYLWVSSELAHREFDVGMFQIRHRWRSKLIQFVSELVLKIALAVMFDREKHMSWLKEAYRSSFWTWTNRKQVVSYKWPLQNVHVQEGSSLFLANKAITTPLIFSVDTMLCLRNRIRHGRIYMVLKMMMQHFITRKLCKDRWFKYKQSTRSEHWKKLCEVTSENLPFRQHREACQTRYVFTVSETRISCQPFVEHSLMSLHMLLCSCNTKRQGVRLSHSGLSPKLEDKLL